VSARGGTIHHLIALFCTVAGKASRASQPLRKNHNEINDLELVLRPVWAQKAFQSKHLPLALNVMLEAQRGRYKM
jgi:hypothetical protein